MTSWGIGDVFITLASRRMGNLKSYFCSLVIGILLISLYIPFAGPLTDWGVFLVAFLLNIIHTGGNLSYFSGLERGNASIMGTLGGAASVVIVALSLIFFHETISLIQIAGIFLTITGIILVSFKIDGKMKLAHLLSDKAIPYGIVTMLCWGFYFTFIRYPAEKIGWFWAGYPLYLQVFLLPWVLPSIRKNLSKVFFNGKNILYALLVALFIVIGDAAYNIGILHGYSSIVGPIANAYAVLFVILARLIFKEPLTLQQKIGIIAVISGIITISIG